MNYLLIIMITSSSVYSSSSVTIQEFNSLKSCNTNANYINKVSTQNKDWQPKIKAWCTEK